MSLSRKRRFVYSTVGVMLATVCAIVLLNALTLELFFIVSFVCFLVLVETQTPTSVSSRWHRRLRWVVLGLPVFGYIAVRRTPRALPEGMI